MQVGGGGQHVARGEGGQRRHGVRFRALLNTRLFGRMVDTEEEIIQIADMRARGVFVDLQHFILIKFKFNSISILSSPEDKSRDLNTVSPRSIVNFS